MTKNGQDARIRQKVWNLAHRGIFRRWFQKLPATRDLTNGSAAILKSKMAAMEKWPIKGFSCSTPGFALKSSIQRYFGVLISKIDISKWFDLMDGGHFEIQDGRHWKSLKADFSSSTLRVTLKFGAYMYFRTLISKIDISKRYDQRVGGHFEIQDGRHRKSLKLIS